MKTATIEEDKYGRQYINFGRHGFVDGLAIDDDTCFSFEAHEDGGIVMRIMTPQEIVDHKFKWLSNPHFEAHVHTDLRPEYKDWLKFWCQKHNYDIQYFSDVYFDTIHFEEEQDFNAFNQWYSER